jgi:glutathione S-transferase
MAIAVHWASGSPFSWRVLLALEHKQIPFESNLLQFSKGDHRTPAYLAMNPRGQVPALRDDTLVVYESIAILAYLDRRFPDRPLFGETPAQAASIWQRVMETVHYLDGPVDAFVLPIYFGRLDTEAAQVKQAIPALHTELGRLDACLAQRAWLCGDGYSAADITTYPMVKSITRAATKPSAAPYQDGLALLSERYPSVGRWMAHIESLPYYDRTYPPHWRQA